MEIFGAMMGVATLALLGVAVRGFYTRRPVATPPPGIEERRSPTQQAGIADTHKAFMALIGAVTMGFMAAMTLSGYVGLPDRVNTIEDRQEVWEQERIIQRVANVEGRVSILEESSRFQTCRSRQLDRGRDPSGCAAWLADPERYEPPAAERIDE